MKQKISLIIIIRDTFKFPANVLGCFYTSMEDGLALVQSPSTVLPRHNLHLTTGSNENLLYIRFYFVLQNKVWKLKDLVRHG